MAVPSWSCPVSLIADTNDAALSKMSAEHIFWMYMTWLATVPACEASIFGWHVLWRCASDVSRRASASVLMLLGCCPADEQLCKSRKIGLAADRLAAQLS